MIQGKLSTLLSGSTALSKAYDGAIERIESQWAEDIALAKTVLSWITSARRLLTSEEIRHALAVKLHHQQLDSDNIYDLEDIISVCAGLVTVDQKSDTIRLVHYTTQEYFTSIQPKWIPNAGREIASTCLTYLCFDTFACGSCSCDADFEDRLTENKFLDYTARYWSQHAMPVQEEIIQVGMTFLRCDNRVSSAVQTASIYEYRYDGYSQHYAHQTTGLHLTAESGLIQLLEALLLAQDDVEADSRDEYGRTPLSWAAANGHEAVVRLLRERNSQPS